jgi:hypothetical protein
MKGVPPPQPGYSQVKGMMDALVGHFVLEPSICSKGYK